MKYSKPPIIEAIFTLNFDALSEPDLTLRGSLYEKIKDSYPIKKVKSDFRIKLDFENNKTAGLGLSNQFGISQYYSEDEKDLVQLSENFLSVNRLEPYSKWENFQPKIQEVIEAFIQIKPIEEYKSCSFRYINAIPIGKNNKQLQDILNVYIQMPESQSGTPYSFKLILNIQRELEIRSDVAIYVQSDKDGTQLILDITYKTEILDFSKELLFSRIGLMHNMLCDYFEEVITDTTREMFVPEVK